MLFNKSTESRLKSLEDTIARLEGELKTLSSSRTCEGCNLNNTTQTIEAGIVVDGKKETFLNHNKKSGNIILPATAANPQLEIRAKVQNSEGIYRYDSVSMLDTVAQGEKSVAIDATIPKTQREMNTNQVNEYLMAEIDKIKLQLKS